jgi:hypothetical protein
MKNFLKLIDGVYIVLNARFSFFEPIQDIGKSFPSMESVDNLFTAAGMHYNFSIKIQSKFDNPIQIRRAGYNGTLDMYDFVEYEL